MYTSLKQYCIRAREPDFQPLEQKNRPFTAKHLTPAEDKGILKIRGTAAYEITDPEGTA
jgi:hypothetical protein